MLTQWSLVSLSRVSTTDSRFVKNNNDKNFFLIFVNSRFFRDKTRLPRTSAEFQNYSFKSINFNLSTTKYLEYKSWQKCERLYAEISFQEK